MMRRPAMLRPLLRVLPAIVAALLSGCDGAAGSPPNEHQATSAAPSIPVSASAVAPAPAAAGTGPCAGKGAGEHACEGQKLLRCEAGGETAEVATCLRVERCDAAQAKCAPACPEGEVYIPATGPDGFLMGRGYRAGRPDGRVVKGHMPNSDVPHKVVLTRPFCMDANEVTVKMLLPCIESGECNRPRPDRSFVTYPSQVDHPVNSYSWPEAKAFCERSGKTLPTEAQWEWAAGGGEGKAYPWGDEPPSCERADYTPGLLPTPAADAGCHGGGPSPAGSHPAGDRVWPSGRLHDMAGNVWEWCLDNFHPYSGKDEVDPTHLESDRSVHVVRGGGWNRSSDGIRVAFRAAARYDYWVPGLGFRCVRNAVP